MDSVRRAAISTFASIAAQAIIRPIIAPVVQGLGLGQLGIGGGGGRRFSQGNRDAATGSVQNIAQLAREIGDSLGGARIGGNVAVGVTNGTLYLDVHGRKGQFANNEDGAKQLSEAAARMVIQEFKSQQVVQNDDYRSILNRSDESLESLGGNLQWYEKIYKVLTQSSSAASAYAKAIEEATKPYNDAIGRAQALGLAEGELVRKRDEAWTRITRARDIETSNLSVGIVSRGVAADAWGGDQGTMKYWQDMQGAANAAETEVTALRLKLEQLGASSEFAATMIAQLETVQRAEAATRALARHTAINDAAIEVNRRAGAAGLWGDAGRYNQTYAAIQTQRGIDAQVTALRKQFEDLGWEAASATVYVERFAQTLWKEYSDREQQRSTKIWDLAIESNRRVAATGAWGNAGAWNLHYSQVQTQRSIEAQVLALKKEFEQLGWSAADSAIYIERFGQALQVEANQREAERVRSLYDIAYSNNMRAANAGVLPGGRGENILWNANNLAERAASREIDALRKSLEELGLDAYQTSVHVERLRVTQQAEARQREAERVRSLYDIAYSNNMRAANAGALPGGRGENIRWNTVNLADRAASREVDALRKSLEELGLDAYQTSVHVERLRVTQQAEANQREAERLSQISQYDQSIQSRLLRANGQTNAAALLEFDAAAAREVQNARKALEELGLGLAEVARRIVETETVLASERVALVKQFAEAAQSQIRQAGQSIRAYIDAQRANSGAGGVSTAEAFSAAQGQFGSDLTLARAGDQDALARITSTADRLLEAGQKQFASGVDFQAVRGFVLASLESLPATRSYDSLILEELKKLGGAVQVEVGVTMIRSITEELNALPEAERNRLIQSGEVQRRILQAVAATTGASLVAPGPVTRTVTQAIEATETVQISRSIDDRLSAILNAQLVIGREEVVLQGRMATDINHIWRYVLGEGGGVTVKAQDRASANLVKFAQGGVFDGPVLFPMRGGGTGMLGEAGPEAIMPLERGSGGRLGVRAHGAGMSDAMARMMDRLAREIADLRAEMQRLVRAGERTADATEDTAASNASMARRDAIVGRRPRAA